MKARYRKYNDRTLSSSTYHKKDGTNIRAKLKKESMDEIKICSDCSIKNDKDNQLILIEDVDNYFCQKT